MSVLWNSNPLNTLKIAWNASDDRGTFLLSALRDSRKKLICMINAIKQSISLAIKWVGGTTGHRCCVDAGDRPYAGGKWLARQAFLARCTTGYAIFTSYLLGED